MSAPWFEDNEVEVRDFTVVIPAERVPDGQVARMVIPRAVSAPGIRVWCLPTEDALLWVLNALTELGVREDERWVSFEDGLGAAREDDDEFGGADESDPVTVTAWLQRRMQGRRVYVSRLPGS